MNLEINNRLGHLLKRKKTTKPVHDLDGICHMFKSNHLCYKISNLCANVAQM